MKIIYLHQYFKTPNMSGGTRSYEMAKRLVANGHQVFMITSWTEETKHADWFYEKIDGIDVYWYPNNYDNKMSYRQRIKAFTSFAKAATKKAITFKDADIIFATSTPLTIAIPGTISSKTLRIPMVFEVRDLWPELPIAIGALKNPVFKFMARKLESWAYAHSAAIVALSPGMKNGVINAGYSASQIAVIPNSSDNSLFDLHFTSNDEHNFCRPWLKDDPLLVYTGTFGKINGVNYMVDLATELKKIESDIKILLVGDGAEKENVIKQAKAKKVLNYNLFIEEPMPKKDIPSLLNRATMASALFIDLPEMRVNSANKFFDALASGTPIFINYGGWMHSLLQKHACGIAAWQQPIDIVAKELHQKMHDSDWLVLAGKRSRFLAEEKFDRDKLAKQLLKVLEKVISNKKQDVEEIAPGNF